MSIIIPHKVGIVYRKSPRTAAEIAADCAQFERRNEALSHLSGPLPTIEDIVSQDEWLFAFTVFTDTDYLWKIIEELEERGLVYGVDYVFTDRGKIFGDAPEWLAVCEDAGPARLEFRPEASR